MSIAAEQSIDTKIHQNKELKFQVWVRGTYTGSVWASNERDARLWAARLFLTTLSEIRVLPAC